jgi:hypothetical protein
MEEFACQSRENERIAEKQSFHDPAQLAPKWPAADRPQSQAC